MKRIMSLSVLVLLASHCLAISAFSQTREEMKEADEKQADLQLELQNAKDHPELANQSGPLHIPPRQDKIIALARKVFPELSKKSDAEVKVALDRKYPKYEVNGMVIQTGGPSQMLQDPAFLKYAKQHPDQVTREAFNTPLEIGAMNRSIEQRDQKVKNLNLEENQLRKQVKEIQMGVPRNDRDTEYKEAEIKALKAQIRDVEAQIRRLGGKPEDRCLKPGEGDEANGYLLNGVSQAYQVKQLGQEGKIRVEAVTHDARFKELKPAISEGSQRKLPESGARGINRADRP
ncbi:MAG: FlxA-like family protein [Methylotenera sp.]|nr:FlxA-like family protein [Oligoflexia bacterium]